MDKQIIINCDGGSRGNPGPAASAFVVSKDGVEIFSEGKFLGQTTNNVAEYTAVLMALEWINQNKEKVGETAIEFVLDSELVVRQLTGIYKIKNENLKELAGKIMAIRKTISSPISFRNVLRDKNKTADELVNKTLDENS